MKRKTFIFALAMALSCTFFGCGANDTASDCEDYGDYDECSACCVELPDDYQVLETTDKEAQTTVEYNGYSFSIFTDGQEVMDNLGEPADHCEGDGFIYNDYDCFAAQFDEIDGKYVVSYFLATDSGVKMANGLEVGSSVDEVKEALGEPSNEYECDGSDYLDYYYDEFAIFFTVKDNTVIDFTLNPNCLSAE